MYSSLTTQQSALAHAPVNRTQSSLTHRIAAHSRPVIGRAVAAMIILGLMTTATHAGGLTFQSTSNYLTTTKLQIQSILTVQGVAVSVVDGNLSIEGSSGDDNGLVYRDGTDYVVKDDYKEKRVPASVITGDRLIFNGNSGDDTLLIPSNIYLRVFASGGDGNDSLLGGPAADWISGGNGDDYLAGKGGDDIIYGDNGNDLIYGGSGDDVIYAGWDVAPNEVYGDEGNDLLVGAGGTDYLHGGNGNDELDGMEGEDYLFGEAGDDLLYAGFDYEYNFLSGSSGNDLLYGSYGDDYMKGGSGKDILWGYEGFDTMLGGDGDDIMYGGHGNDWMHGGSGYDVLHGDAGSDSLNGGDDDEVTDSLWGGANESDTFFNEEHIDEVPPPGFGYTPPNSEIRDEESIDIIHQI